MFRKWLPQLNNSEDIFLRIMNWFRLSQACLTLKKLFVTCKKKYKSTYMFICKLMITHTRLHKTAVCNCKKITYIWGGFRFRHWCLEHMQGLQSCAINSDGNSWQTTMKIMTDPVISTKHNINTSCAIVCILFLRLIWWPLCNRVKAPLMMSHVGKG